MISYDSLLSARVRELKPSGIRKFFDLLSSMDDVVALTVGQPDFVTPWHIREAAIDSLERGRTYYTSNAGTTELRRGIAAYLSRRFSLSYDPLGEIIVTVGGSEAIDIAIRTVLDPGDEVIIPVPSFVCYEPLTRMAGGVPVMLETLPEDGFKLTPERLRAAITPRTKLLVLPFPNNPTGAILTEEELAGIAEVLRGTNVLVLSDEIYAELTYGRTHTSIAAIPDMRERTILVSGFSKAYAMTGWRLGYIAAPAPLAKEMLKLHQYAIMCAPTASQFAAVEALKNGDEDIAMMREEYDRRRAFLLDGLAELGLPCFPAEGAFYLYPYIGGYGLSSEEFCERLLHEERCAIVPGTAFGAVGEGYARISYAYSMHHLEEALVRIGKFLEKLKTP